MPREFLTWYAEQMLEWVPSRLRRSGTTAPDALVIALRTAAPPGGAPQEAEVTLRRGGQETPLGRFALDAEGLRALNGALRGRSRPPCIVLRPPGTALLERRVTLPLAVRRDPDGVLRYEMHRLTPFTLDEVFWAWRMERKDVPGGTVRLRVSVLPKAGLLAPIEALRSAGLEPAWLEAVSPDGRRQEIGIDLSESRQGVRREAWRRGGLVAVGVLCAVLVSAAVSLPFLAQSKGLAAADKQIEALRGPVEEAERLQRQIAENAGRRDAMAVERARVGEALQVIALVTEILPDDTHLTELTLRQRRLTMAGRSGAAARLIPLLSAAPMIRDAAFSAPVTRRAAGQADSFSITAAVGM
jgi:general secretion pathway protein L